MAAALAGGIAAGWTRRALFAVAVEGRSMSPALEPGDWLIVRRDGVQRERHAVGSVVCVQDADGRVLVKRIAGAPGATLPGAGRALRGDEYFVLGDNLDASTDSRHFGPVPATRILGVARVRYWPPERAGLIAQRPPTDATALRCRGRSS